MRGMDRWEFAVIAACPVELRQLGKSRWLSLDWGYDEPIGGVFRLVVMGWGLIVWRPMRA